VTTFIIVNETVSAPLRATMTDDWLDAAAAACTIALNRDVASYWGGNYMVRRGEADAVNPDEIVCALVDNLPDAPGAVAYHDRNGNALPVVFVAVNMCNSLADVDGAMSHEFNETVGDPGCNRWADDGNGAEYALELSDAIESSGYDVNGHRMADFLLTAFFVSGAPGPYSYGEAVGVPRLVAGPFATAPGGYQIKRDASGQTVQVNGALSHARAAKVAHWSSRVARRQRRR